MVWSSGCVWCQRKEGTQESTPNELFLPQNFPKGILFSVLGMHEGQPAMCWPLIITIPELVTRLRKEQGGAPGWLSR